MTEVLDTLRVEFEYSTDVWTDVTNDVIYPMSWVEGMPDYGPLNVTAFPGILNLTLDNGITNTAGLRGYYSPGHTNAKAGFAIGLNVRVYVEWQGNTRIRFKGSIMPNGIDPTFDKFGSRITNVKVEDWFGQAAKQRITLPEFAENKRLDEVVPLVVALSSAQPGGTNYNQGDSTFPFVFDTVRDETTIRREIDKATISEFGYAYLTHSSDVGDVLTVDGRTTRTGQAIKKLPVSNDDAGFLLLEDGNFLLQENGGKIVLNRTADAEFDNIAVTQPASKSGKHFTNRVSAVTYPRRVDAAATTVLYELQSPIKLDAGETRTGYRITYRDPDGAAFRTNGRDMQVFDTDSLAAWTSSDGTGSDVTASLNVTGPGGTSDISDIYGTEGAEYTFENGTGAEMWITTLQAIGKGVYLYDPVQYITQDTDSQATNGTVNSKFNLFYQDDPNVGRAYSDKVLGLESDGRSHPEPPVYCANSNGNNMAFFVTGNIGDRITFKEDQQAFDGDYFVQGMRVRVEEGNTIYYSIVLLDGTGFDYWQIGVAGASEIGISTTVAFPT